MRKFDSDVKPEIERFGFGDDFKLSLGHFSYVFFVQVWRKFAFFLDSDPSVHPIREFKISICLKK